MPSGRRRSKKLSSDRDTDQPIVILELDEFTRANAPTDGDDGFQTQNKRLLDVPVDGTVLIKAGSMVGYTGEVTFTGKSSAEGGLTEFVKDAVTNEGTPIMEAEGSGGVYVADRGKKVRILDLGEGESIS